MANDSGGLFGGLKKLLFKDDFAPEAPHPVPATPAPSPQHATSPSPAASFGVEQSAPGGNAEGMKARAYQMLESINQPGVDFMEVWNASEEAGGITPQTVKTSFNALKYADKTLTKEKLLTSGEYYCTQLRKAIDGDLQKKAALRQQLDQQKTAERQNLASGIAAMEAEIRKLQADLSAKQSQLAALDATYEPKLRSLDETMQAGKTTIDAMIREMQTLLDIARREL